MRDTMNKHIRGNQRPQLSLSRGFRTQHSQSNTPICCSSPSIPQVCWLHFSTCQEPINLPPSWTTNSLKLVWKPSQRQDDTATVHILCPLTQLWLMLCHCHHPGLLSVAGHRDSPPLSSSCRALNVAHCQQPQASKRQRRRKESRI
jgi:hypothetical protein